MVFAVLAGVLLCWSAVPALTGQAQGATAAAVAPSGLASLNACVNARAKTSDTPTLRLAVVIDESGSLRDSDPGNARVTAAKALVDQLANQGATRGFTVSALVAGFASGVDNSTGFQPLTPVTVGGFSTSIDAFAGRNSGETDYWSAIQQIRTIFADARGGADPTDPAAAPCQAVVLVTDGKFDLQQRATTKPYPGVENVEIDTPAAVQRVVAAGVADLCRTAGPVDALRADQITLIAVGLKGEQSTPDFSLLQRMATGAPSPCGAQPPNGVFFQADDVSDLILILATIGSDDQGGEPPVPTDVCQPANVAQCPGRTFQLSPAFTAADLLGAIDADDIAIQLFTQDGVAATPIAYVAGSTNGMVQVAGVTLTYHWYSPRAFTIRMTGRESPSWNGQWTARFIDTTGKNPDAVAKTQFSVQPDLYVDADLGSGTAAGARPGEKATVKFALRNGLGETITALDPGLSVAAVATVTPKAAGAKTVTVKDGITVADTAAPFIWAVPPDLPVGPAVLTVTTTVSFGSATYAPDEHQEQVSVLPPFTAPTISGTVVFPLGTGTDPVSAPLTVVAPQQGSGCVWVDGAQLTAAPASVSSVAVSSSASSASSCRQIAAGTGKQTLTLQLRPSAEANGQLTGTVQVHLRPEGSGTASIVAVRFTGSLQRSVNGNAFGLAFGLAMLIGIGLPILVYVLIRRRGARFPAANLQYVICPVVLEGGRLEVGTVAARPPLDVRSSRRETRADAYELRAVAGWRPTEAGHVQVRRGGWVGIGDTPPFQRDGAAVIPVALAGSWAVFVPDRTSLAEGTRADGELLVIVPAARSDEFVQRLLQRAAQEFHQRQAQLASSVGAPERELVGVGGGGNGPGTGFGGWDDPAPVSGGTSWPGASPPADTTAPPTSTGAWGTGGAGGAGTANDPAPSDGPPDRPPAPGPSWWDNPGTDR